MPSTKYEGLSYPIHFLKSRGSVLRNNFLEYSTNQATLFARRMTFMHCSLQIKHIYTPANFVCRGFTVFTLSVCASVRPSVSLCFLNNSKSHCRIFIKPCKHVHICKTNTLDKKVRARGHFY